MRNLIKIIDKEIYIDKKICDLIDKRRVSYN